MSEFLSLYTSEIDISVVHLIFFSSIVAIQIADDIHLVDPPPPVINVPDDIPLLFFLFKLFIDFI